MGSKKIEQTIEQKESDLKGLEAAIEVAAGQKEQMSDLSNQLEEVRSAVIAAKIELAGLMEQKVAVLNDVDVANVAFTEAKVNAQRVTANAASEAQTAT